MSGTVEETQEAEAAQETGESPGTGELQSAEETPETPETPETLKSSETPAEAPAARPRGRGPLVVAVAVLLLVLGGAGLLFRAHQLRSTPAAANQALTDTEATAQVTGDVSDALGKVLSYTPQATGVTEQAARELLAGKAARQYGALFGQVGKRAQEQKLTLTTQVVRAGVTRLTGSEAHLLVFLDQTAQRKGKPAEVVAAQLSVTAELRGGNWLITDITAR
ncbi:hypothetical protein [Streptomyces sp. NBC_01500]|uniref:hypothetical protein n=1 Tax=Streptomyces sp. NBC_01500 TaxID=2903886 RepID=UPI00225AB54E|nr:hypothetical protein [Streptomyces sp. NBC_01500]MCX4553816.1 hypothetical protein [Streptomyces sp. NBC_01500]